MLNIAICSDLPLPSFQLLGHAAKLDLPQEQRELLRKAVFPEWKDDAARAGVESPDEMQKKDPLSMQIWRLYSKTRSQLPNQERMENLTWRMMAMNLKRKERDSAIQSQYVQTNPR